VLDAEPAVEDGDRTVRLTTDSPFQSVQDCMRGAVTSPVEPRNTFVSKLSLEEKQVAKTVPSHRIERGQLCAGIHAEGAGEPPTT